MLSVVPLNETDMDGGTKKKKKGGEEGDGGRGRGTDGNGKKAKCDKN